MSYQVLARKWRPKNFSELIGQEHVVRALSHALTTGRVHHAYLFTGTRGIGKTTIARILAKSLNCTVGITPEPCGQCSACIEIDSGRYVDLIEVDAATNTRVEEMRQLLENAVYFPTQGRYKVYVIDEVHMLSNSAFNAMLKTLEEPPDHVKFILATTDPQKIPVTVLSRCLQFNLKQMSPVAISEHLAALLTHENIDFERTALHLIAHAAAGSMRDALSLLDQSIAHGGGKVLANQVSEMLGTVSNDHLFKLLFSLLIGDAAAMAATADEMQARSLSFEAALKTLSKLITQIQLAQLAPQAIADDLPGREQIMELAQHFAAEMLQLIYQITIHGLRDLPMAPDPYTGFLMTLLRLAAFEPHSPSSVDPKNLQGSTSNSTIHGSKDTNADPTKKATSLISPTTTKADTHTPIGTLEKPESVIHSTYLELKATSLSDNTQNSDDHSSLIITTKDQASSAHIEGETINTELDLSKPINENIDWTVVLPQLGLAGMARELAYHCLFGAYQHDEVRLILPTVHRYLNNNKPAENKIQQALTKFFARPIKLHIEMVDTDNATPADTARAKQKEQQAQSIIAIESDVYVQEIIELLDAHLIDSSIKPA